MKYIRSLLAYIFLTHSTRGFRFNHSVADHSACDLFEKLGLRSHLEFRMDALHLNQGSMWQRAPYLRHDRKEAKFCSSLAVLHPDLPIL